MKIQVTCPNCGSRLAFEEQPGIETKILKCPKCDYTAQVCQYPRTTPKTEKLQNPPAPPAADDKGDTRIVIETPVNTDAGQLHVKETDQFVSLKRGKQVVGRLAKKKVADIQIGSSEPTAAPLDMTMSRYHIVITVEADAAGNLRHIVCEHPDKPTNGTYINGKKMAHDDQYVLHFGDTLTLGKTNIVLEPTDEEATKVII